MRLYYALLVLAAFVAPETLEAKKATTPVAAVTIACLDDVRINLDKDGAFQACLFVDETDRLHIAAIDKAGFELERAQIKLAWALAILANPEAEALHPVMIRAAGNDFAKLRKAELNDIKARDFQSPFNENSLVSLNPNAIGRLIDKSRALIGLGYREEAMAAVRKLLDGYAAKVKRRNGKPLSDEQQWRWYSVRSTYAGMVFALGDTDEALSLYRDLIADDRINSSYRTNAKVNLAAYLAEAGKFADALAMIEEAGEEFDLQAETADHFKLGGSNRHFTWIKACALHGLGRTKEAEPLIETLLASPEKPAEFEADIYATSSIEQRLYYCMSDTERMIAWMNRIKPHPLYGYRGSLLLQPGLVMVQPSKDAFLKRLREHPDVQKLSIEFKVLPDALVPALNRWR